MKYVVRFLLSLLFYSIGAQVAGAGGGEEIHLDGDLSEKKAVLTVSWDNPLEVAPELKNNEVFIRFADAILVKETDLLKKTGHNWIENIVVGYDSIFIRSVASTTVNLLVNDTSLSIVIHREKPFESIDKVSNTELQLVRVRLSMQQGRFKEAFTILDGLARENPHDVSVLLELAGAEFEIGHRRKPLEILEREEFLELDNRYVSEMKRQLRNTYRTKLTLETAAKKMDNRSSDYFYRVYASTSVQRYMIMAFRIGRYDGSDSNAVDFHKGAYQGGIDVLYDFESGNRAEVKTYLNEGGSHGIGIEYRLQGIKVKTVFGAEFNRPNWNYFAGTIENDARNGLRAGCLYTFTPRFKADISTSINRYRLADQRNTPGSYAVQGRVQYTFPPYAIPGSWLGEDGNVSLDYSLDTEQPTGEKEDRVIIESRFQRTTHTTGITLGKRIRDLQIVGYFSYYFNVTTDDGPGFGISLSYARNDDLDGYVSVGRQTSGREGEFVEEVLAGVTWLF
ncbi:MAG: tetratricopeptide repeat protein [Proteobacteria bacterium]|nr:tetratricopeptide repeat protein [Pseudomonadota bacterium]